MSDKIKQKLTSKEITSVKLMLFHIIECISFETTQDGRVPNDSFIKLITEKSYKDPQKVVNTLMNYYMYLDRAFDKQFLGEFKEGFLSRNKNEKMKALHKTKSEGQCDDTIRNFVDPIIAKTKSKLEPVQFFLHRMSDPIRAIRAHLESHKEIDAVFAGDLKNRCDNLFEVLEPLVHRNMASLYSESKSGVYVRV